MLTAQRQTPGNPVDRGNGFEIRAISFDFWNTLFREQPGGFTLYRKRRHILLSGVLAEHGHFTREQIEKVFREESELHNRIWIDEHRTVSTGERVRSILSRFGVTLEDDVLRELVNLCEEGVLERPPVLVDGARETVQRLRARYRLGIISDVGFSPGRVLRRVLADAGILHLFDSTIFSDEAGRSKPHAEVFERTSRMLEARPGEIVHIGDLEHTDIVGAKRAGYRAIRYTGVTPMSEDESTLADLVTSEFVELPSLIDKLQARSA